MKATFFLVILATLAVISVHAKRKCFPITTNAPSTSETTVTASTTESTTTSTTTESTTTTEAPIPLQIISACDFKLYRLATNNPDDPKTPGYSPGIAEDGSRIYVGLTSDETGALVFSIFNGTIDAIEFSSAYLQNISKTNLFYIGYNPYFIWDNESPDCNAVGFGPGGLSIDYVYKYVLDPVNNFIRVAPPNYYENEVNRMPKNCNSACYHSQSALCCNPPS